MKNAHNAKQGYTMDWMTEITLTAEVNIKDEAKFCPFANSKFKLRIPGRMEYSWNKSGILWIMQFPNLVLDKHFLC